MNIQYLENNEIIFNEMRGKLMNANIEYMDFLKKICKIDTNCYEYIYRLDDGWAGSVLLVKDLSYRCFKCGSGVPIVDGSDKTGVLNVI